tara:strand:+ start:115 stop:4392 length:4278 start_codon:yes stop_codon:yes gene_type:complete
MLAGMVMLGGCPSGSSGGPAQNSASEKPVTQWVSTPDARTKETQATFEFSASTENATFVCRLDSGERDTCTSPHVVDGLAEGTHYFEVRATSSEGLQEMAAQLFEWEVDLTPPDTVFETDTASPTNQVAATFSFETESDVAAFECAAQNDSFNSCSSPWTVQGQEGENQIQIRAIDDVGNVDPSPAVFQWTIDTVAPRSTIVTGPPELSTESQVTIEVTVDEETSGFECTLNDLEWGACRASNVVNNLSHGRHVFHLKAVDLAGNIEENPVVFQWETDIEGPIIEVWAQPAARTNETSATFQWNQSEAGTVYCKLDARPEEICEASKTFTSLNEGEHIFTIYAEDGFGNTSEAQEFQWTVDTSKPITTIMEGPEDHTQQTEATFTFESNESDVTFYCGLQEDAMSLCESPLTLTGLSDGTRLFSVYAVDAAGNEGAGTAKWSWTVDTTAPIVTWTGPAERTNSVSAEFQGDNLDASTFECFLNDAPYADCAASFTITDLAEGPHEFRGRGRDLAGNWSEEFTWTWEVDTTPPSLTVDTQPEDTTTMDEATFTFSFEAGATVFCRVRPVDYAPCESPVTFSGLTHGNWFFDIYAADDLNNFSEPITVNWSVDTVPPQTTWLDTPPAINNLDQPVFSFSADEPVAQFFCSHQGATFEPCTSPVTLDSLTDGQQNFAVYAVDLVGNTEQDEAVFNWWLDRVPPEISWTGPIARTTETSATFASDAMGLDIFECTLDDVSIPNCGTQVVFTDLADGTHTFVGRVSDAAGNWSPDFTWTWTVDTTPPEVLWVATPSSYTNETMHTVTYSTEADALVYCRLNDADFDVCEPSSVFDGLEDGVYTFDVYAKDDLNNESEWLSYSWTQDTEKPELFLVHSITDPTLDTSATFEIQVSDGETVTLECELNSETLTDCEPTMTFDDLEEAEHEFRVRGTDAAGNVSLWATFAWYVNYPPAAPDFTMVPGLNIGVTSAQFGFDSEETNVGFQCSKNEGQFFDCESPYTWSELTNGEYRFEVRTLDDYGASSEASITYAFTVNLCGNGVLNGGEVCDGAAVCTDLSNDHYVSGTATCVASCSAYDMSACVYRPFSLGQENITFDNEIGTIDKMWALQLVPGGKEEIVVAYLQGKRGKYIDVTDHLSPTVVSLFDYTGAMEDMWLTDFDGNGDVDLIYAKIPSDATGGNNTYRWTAGILDGGSTLSLGTSTIGFQAGVMAQFVPGGDKELVVLAQKHVVVHEESIGNTVITNQTMSAMAVGDFIDPGDSANEIAIFDYGAGDLVFYQGSTTNINVVGGASLGAIQLHEMVTTDFNEDGLDDLLMAGMNGVTTYLNLGNSGFDYRPVANIEGAAHLHAIDLDLDGDMDVGFWVPDTERVYWAEQLEVDSWDVHLIQDFGDSSGTISDVVFSDVDGDGDWDCLVAEITGTIFWTENKSIP